MYFDGSTDISYLHEFEGATFIAGLRMYAYLVRPNGDEIQIDYIGGSFSSQYSSLIRSEVGYYSIRLRYGVYGVFASADAEVDDFSTTASLIAPDIVETAVACHGETVQYIPTGSVNDNDNPFDFEYNWSWVGTPGGTLTEQTANDQ